MLLLRRGGRFRPTARRAMRLLSGSGGEELKRGVSRRTEDIRKSFPRRLSRTEHRLSILDNGRDHPQKDPKEDPKEDPKGNGIGQQGANQKFTSHSYGDFLSERSLSRDTTERGKKLAKTLSRKERVDAVKRFYDSTHGSRGQK